MQMNQPNRCSN